MNGHIDRIVYAHRGSPDFGPVCSSLSPGRRDWARKLMYRARLKFQPQRPNSTVYWTDGETAVVIRRVPGHQGDGRDDRAFALLGTIDQLTVYQALALADDSPVWMDNGWYRESRIDPITVDELPVPLPPWSPQDAGAVLPTELWPLVHAFEQRPDVPILVATDMAEPAMVGLIRSLIGMGQVIRQDAGRWSFSTREDQPAQGDIQPRIQFLPRWSGAGGGTVVRYSDVDTVSADAARYEHLVEVYLANGPDALREELRRAPVAAGTAPIPDQSRSAAPPTYQESQQHPGQPDDPPPHRRSTGEPNHTSPPPQSPPAQTAWQLFQSLPNNARDAIPGLVQAVVLAPATDTDRTRIRQDLADSESQFRQRIRAFSPSEQDRILAPLLVMTMRTSGWESRQVTRSMDRLLRAIGGASRHGRRRRTQENAGLGPNLSLHIIWVLALVLVLLTFVLIYT